MWNSKKQVQVRFYSRLLNYVIFVRSSSSQLCFCGRRQNLDQTEFMADKPNFRIFRDMDNIDDDESNSRQPRIPETSMLRDL